MNISDLHRRISVTSLFDEEYLSIISYAESQGYAVPSKSQQLLQSNLLKSLKNSGIWNKLDVFYLFATDGDRNFAKINWKNTANFFITESGTVNFLTNLGFKGNGTNGLLDTNFNILNDGINYQELNASRNFYVFEAPTIGNRIDGNFLNTINRSVYLNNVQQRINAGYNNLNSLFDYTIGLGLKSIHRLNSQDVVLFNQKTSGIRTQLQGLMLSQTQQIMTNSSQYSNIGISLYSMGSNLVNENSDYNDIIDTYMASI